MSFEIYYIKYLILYLMDYFSAIHIYLNPNAYLNKVFFNDYFINLN